jgi:hypothetical protein
MKKPNQRNLFDTPAFRLGSLNRVVKQTLNKVVSESKFSREEVLDEINQLATQGGISLCSGSGGLGMATFNKWLDPNATAYIPGLVALVVLCEALDNNSPLAVLLEVLDLSIMGPEDRRYRDLGKLSEEMKVLKKKKRQIEESI